MTKLQKALLGCNIILFVFLIIFIIFSRVNADKFLLSEPIEPYIIETQKPVNKNDIIISEKFDINKATKEQLMSINGIGEKMAQNILDFLKINGGINSFDELLRIKGIGESKLEIIEKYAVIGG